MTPASQRYLLGGVFIVACVAVLVAYVWGAA